MREWGAGPDLGWKKLVQGELKLVSVEGTHMSMFSSETAERLAQVLREEFARVIAKMKS
jgi:thioesterase domain-containing protein